MEAFRRSYEQPGCKLWRSLLGGGFSVACAVQTTKKSRVEAHNRSQSARKAPLADLLRSYWVRFKEACTPRLSLLFYRAMRPAARGRDRLEVEEAGLFQLLP
jgi:hypothetical protein